ARGRAPGHRGAGGRQARALRDRPLAAVVLALRRGRGLSVATSDDLDVLENGIRQLQIEWEKFFGGVEKKPPNDLKTRMEPLIRKSASSETRNNADRFRSQTLSSPYNTFNELWSKRLRAREEGRPVGLHGQFERHAPPPPSHMAAPPSAAKAGGSGEVRVKD